MGEEAEKLKQEAEDKAKEGLSFIRTWWAGDPPPLLPGYEWVGDCEIDLVEDPNDSGNKLVAIFIPPNWKTPNVDDDTVAIEFHIFLKRLYELQSAKLTLDVFKLNAEVQKHDTYIQQAEAKLIRDDRALAQTSDNEAPYRKTIAKELAVLNSFGGPDIDDSTLGEDDGIRFISAKNRYLEAMTHLGTGTSSMYWYASPDAMARDMKTPNVNLNESLTKAKSERYIIGEDLNRALDWQKRVERHAAAWRDRAAEIEKLRQGKD